MGALACTSVSLLSHHSWTHVQPRVRAPAHTHKHARAHARIHVHVPTYSLATSTHTLPRPPPPSPTNTQKTPYENNPQTQRQTPIPKVRSLLGTSSYVLFTLDKLVYKLVRHMQAMTADEQVGRVGCLSWVGG
jgi:hypothetical protein